MSHKLGYIFFECLGEDLALDFSYDFENNVRFMRKIPSINEAPWHEWLGLQWQDVVTSNAVIEVKSETQNPKILDNENKELEFKCRKLWLSLMLTGPFYLDNAYFLTGSEINNKIEIRRFFKFDRWFHPGDNFVETITDIEVNKWKNIFLQIKEIYKRKEDFTRFKRGLLCFLKGCNESQVFFRLPYFVRSLEALSIPDKGKTARQFKSRVSQWWPANSQKGHFSEDAMTTLSEIYDLRCDFEHMHPSKINDVNKQLLRSYQCEKVARNAYYDILMNSNKLKMFINDDTIKRFWVNQ